MLYFIVVYLWNIMIFPMICIVMKPFQITSLSLDLCFDSFIYSSLQIKHSIHWDTQLIEDGFILGNHRCALDWPLDCFITNSTCIGRRMAFVASGILALLVCLEDRGIVIRRGKDNRQEIYKKSINNIKTNHRVCFWPEGTRLNYTKLSSKEEVRSYLKYGLLKEIYINKSFPVQLCISSNKEIAFNEKRLIARRGIPIRTIISKSIHPKEFETEEDFYNEIAITWLDCWTRAYD